MPNCDFKQTDVTVLSKYPEFKLSLHETLGPQPFMTPPLPRPTPLKTQLQGLSDKDKNKFKPHAQSKFVAKFNLGNSYKTRNVLEAAEILRKREYPTLHRTNQNGPTFIPIFFIPKHPILVSELDTHQKDIVEKEGATSDNTSVQQLYNDKTVFDNNTKTWKNLGDEAERNVFHGLQKVLNQDPEARDVIVLHELHTGTKSAKGGFKMNEQEHDFFIISPRRKLFSPFEVKSTLFTFNHHKAAVQLRKSQKMVQDFWWDLFDNEGWSFCPTVYFSNKNNASICKEKCSRWTLFEEADFHRWWEDTKQEFKPVNEAEHQKAREKCLQVVQHYLFNLHINVPKSVPLTTSSYIEEVTKLMQQVGHAHQIMFWNRGQYELMRGPDNNFILFRSPYGTGKSVLMTYKCEEEARNNFNSNNGKRCLYAFGGNFATKKYTLLHLQQIRKWQGEDFFQNIDVLSIYDIMVSKETIIG